MTHIATYVFLDLETTGLPSEEINKTKITELSMIAVKRQHVLDTRTGAAPRVQNKLTLCFNPGRMVQPESTKVTGLCNDLLEYETYFNEKVFSMIDTFLNVLTPPVCLIAQNGLNFDFPILKAHIDKLKTSFSEKLLCADCFHGFYDILEAKKQVPNDTPSKPDSELVSIIQKENSEEFTSCDEADLISISDTISMQAINETTPKKPLAQNLKKLNEANGKEKLKSMKCKARRRFPWSEGLLVLTGALWGCTNPFIRQGTRGLRAVRADTWLQQAYAEIIFLLGNWRYVLPWVINQCGSLSYLVAIQNAPLSVAVPVANGLAFAFTAATGAAVGTEEPLDKGSVLGIVLIVAGTALCCWEKAD